MTLTGRSWYMASYFFKRAVYAGSGQPAVMTGADWRQAKEEVFLDRVFRPPSNRWYKVVCAAGAAEPSSPGKGPFPAQLPACRAKGLQRARGARRWC